MAMRAAAFTVFRTPFNRLPFKTVTVDWEFALPWNRVITFHLKLNSDVEKIAFDFSPTKSSIDFYEMSGHRKT